MSDNDCHISSYIVQVKPGLLPEVLDQLTRSPGVTVPITEPEKDKCIVVLECVGEQNTRHLLASIEAIIGVLAVILVYHQVEPV